MSNPRQREILFCLDQAIVRCAPMSCRSKHWGLFVVACQIRDARSATGESWGAARRERTCRSSSGLDDRSQVWQESVRYGVFQSSSR